MSHIYYISKVASHASQKQSPHCSHVTREVITEWKQWNCWFAFFDRIDSDEIFQKESNDPKGMECTNGAPDA